MAKVKNAAMVAAVIIIYCIISHLEFLDAIA